MAKIRASLAAASDLGSQFCNEAMAMREQQDGVVTTPTRIKECGLYHPIHPPRSDGRLRRRRQMILGDERDELVTFATPSVASRWDDENEQHPQ